MPPRSKLLQCRHPQADQSYGNVYSLTFYVALAEAVALQQQPATARSCPPLRATAGGGRAITDGASNTRWSASAPTPDNFWGWAAYSTYNDTGTAVWRSPNTTLRPRRANYTCQLGRHSWRAWRFCNFNTVYSVHTGGANFLFADGHTSFLSYQITQPLGSSTVIQALVTIGGGESPGNYD